MSKLYIVPTPIGNIDDMVPRAVSVLQQVDVIAAEDTRHSGKLLQHLAIKTNMVAYHEHNEREQADKLIAQILAGKSVALISDAGTPLVSDPGFRIVAKAVENGIDVIPIPGPVAAMVALSASGLPCDRFCFEGFLPSKQSKRLASLSALKDESRTLIFYESPHRVLATLQDMLSVFGADRRATVARELTKQFETIKTAHLDGLCEWVAGDSNQQRGEFVLLVEGAPEKVTSDADALALALRLSKELPPNKAAAVAADICGVNKRALYKAIVADSGDV